MSCRGTPDFLDQEMNDLTTKPQTYSRSASPETASKPIIIPRKPDHRVSNQQMLESRANRDNPNLQSVIRGRHIRNTTSPSHSRPTSSTRSSADWDFRPRPQSPVDYTSADHPAFDGLAQVDARFNNATYRVYQKDRQGQI